MRKASKETKASTSSIWTADEDSQLRALVARFGVKQWVVVASHLKNKNSKQVRRRWKNCLNADNKQGGWSAEEDRILLEGHQQFGNKWTEIAKLVGGRTDNAVKNRWAALCKRGERPAVPAKRGRKKTSEKIPCVTQNASPHSATGSEDGQTVSTSDSEAEEAPAKARSGSNRRTPSRSGPATTHTTPEGSHLEAQLEHAQQQQQAVQVQQQAQQQRQRLQEEEQPALKRSRLSNGACLDMSLLPQGSGSLPTHTGSGPSRRHSHPKALADERNTSSTSPPSRYQDLTLLIPNSNADPPTAPPQPTLPAYYQGMEFRVFKDALSPADKRFAQEINSMDIPLHINIEDAPLTTSRRAQQEALNALMEGSPTTTNGGPLTLTGYGPGGLHTSTSATAPLPSARLVSSTSSQPEQFNELLRFLHNGVTPHSTKPAPMPNGVSSRTPRSAGTAGRIGMSPANTSKSCAGQQAQQQAQQQQQQQQQQLQQQQQQLQQQQQQQQQEQQQCQPQVAGQQGSSGPLSPRRSGMRSSTAAQAANAQPSLGEGHLHLLGRLFNSAHQTAEVGVEDAELVSPCPGSPSFLPPSLLASPVHHGASITSGPLAPNVQTRQQALLLQQQQQQQQQFQFQFHPTPLQQPYCQLQPFPQLPPAIPSPLYVPTQPAAFASTGLEVVGMHIPPQVLQQQEQQQQQQQLQQLQHRHPGPLGQLQLSTGIPSEAAWQGIDVLTTPSLSGPELSLLLDALNSSR